MIRLGKRVRVVDPESWADGLEGVLVGRGPDVVIEGRAPVCVWVAHVEPVLEIGDTVEIDDADVFKGTRGVLVAMDVAGPYPFMVWVRSVGTRACCAVSPVAAE